MAYGNITDVPGIKVGNVENMEAITGCSVVVAENGAVCGVDVRGSAPGTRETALLDPVNIVNQVHAITLSGGSAFGLAAADGVMHYLEEQGIGLDVRVARVPIVPAAILFDLALGDSKARPDEKMGYQAAKQAKKGFFSFGNVGAGCGATVGKVAGFKHCMKGGLGSASVELDNGIVVGALVAVNAVGDIRHPDTGEILAGPIDLDTQEMMDSITYMQKHQSQMSAGMNTTIGVIATNASLTKAEATKISQIAHNALAKTIYPARTLMDGDTIFTLSTGKRKQSIDLIGTMAVETLEQSIVQAILAAESIGGIPASKTYKLKNR